MKKRRLEIVVETERCFTVKMSGPSPTVRCEQCCGALIFAEEAVAITGLSARSIHRLVEAGEIHFAETPGGALLVCPDSLTGGPGAADGGKSSREMAE